MKNNLDLMVGANETIMFQGKPNKKAFLLEEVFNPLLPVAILWGAIDFSVLKFSFQDMTSSGSQILIPFLLLHLMPVWLYLGGVLFMLIKYINTRYIVTDQAVYVSGGIFVKTYLTKPFSEMSHINIHEGIFDQLFRVGDVIITTNQLSTEGKPVTITLRDLTDYLKVFSLIKKIQLDVYTDTMYPNDLRPNENHGYKTKYRP